MIREQIYTKEDKIKALHYMKVLILHLEPYQPEIRDAILIATIALQNEVREYRGHKNE